MRKSFVTMGLVLAISATSAMTAFAGWEQTGATWKYNSNGTYFNNGWNWIDGNGDNVAECYYFGIDGVMLANTTTPDNYNVNADGQWVVDGVVQTKAVNLSDGDKTQNNQSTPTKGATENKPNRLAELLPGWTGPDVDEIDIGGDFGAPGNWN